MKLKRVKIFGFKTFADKTEFDLDGNIIAVVGPNGCGKSNIVDAILWGLGETNARQLRAQTGKEVIFSGSSRRKPLGFAEVMLHFDNEDGTLPIESAEVSVSRRLTRAGESDYQINRRSCRLRDVNDLLADSGLGRAGYAIVGQSEIDQALAASAQQRRAWIDEAAGVQRYRLRRHEAIRRLDSTEQHLQRVRDIIREIEQQREPLAEEAELAKQYKGLVGALREVETSLLAHDLSACLADLNAQEDRIASAERLIREERKRGEDLEREAEEARELMVSLEGQIDRLRQALATAQAEYEHWHATILVARQKLEGLVTLESTLSEEAGHATKRVEELILDFEKSSEEALRDLQLLEQLQEELSGVGAEAEALRRELKDLEATLTAERKRAADLQRAELENAHRTDRLRQVLKEIQGIEETLPDLEEAFREAETQEAQLLEQVNAAKATKSATDQELQALKRREDQGAQRVRETLSEVASLEGKRRGLEHLIESHEGLAQGAKAVLTLVDHGQLADVYRPVGTVISVESDLALALDIALGASGNDLIVPNQRDAQEAIELLKRNRLGRATFQPIHLMRPPHQTQELRAILREPGIVGLASELVTCDSDARPVIDSLLGRVVIVEELDQALRLAKTSGWSRMVTLDGEVVHSSGAVTGGMTSRTGTGLVQRQAELEETIAEIDSLRTTLAGWEKEKQKFQRLSRELEQQIEAAQTEVNNQGKEYDETRAWVMNLRHEWQSTLKAKEKLEAEKQTLRSGGLVESGPADVEALEAQRDTLLRSLAAKSSDAESAHQRLSEADLRAKQAEARAKEAERRLLVAQESAEHRQKRSESIAPERIKLDEEIRLAEEKLQEAEGVIQGLRDQSQSLTLQKVAAAENAQLLQESVKSSLKSLSSCEDSMRQGEILRAKAESKRATVTERLLEEYGLSGEEAISQFGEAELPPDAPSLVSRLRREIKGMGDVNLGAIEAYDRLSERYEELHHQVLDIEEGRAEVEASIKELDRLTREKFVSTFDQLKVSFSEVFTTMFGGGEGSLELTEADNILDSGVDIQVTVPGKKRQRLELLSGGERAMSALAFLFSLLRVKPSPLVILDEVDAPLDGRNVERFVQAMRGFNDKTQFILITHNPVTIESADVWFGVTMQEPGVSTLVPFKVPGRAVAEISSVESLSGVPALG
jgi:chromosome segregation protein